MRKVTRKSRSLIAVLVMLLVIGAMAWPSARPTNASAFGCRDCGLQCANEAYYYMDQCYRNGGTTEECKATYNRYVRNCTIFFCNYGLGCDFYATEDGGPIE